MQKILTIALVLYTGSIHADSSCAERAAKHYSCDIAFKATEDAFKNKNREEYVQEYNKLRGLVAGRAADFNKLLKQSIHLREETIKEQTRLVNIINTLGYLLVKKGVMTSEELSKIINNKEMGVSIPGQSPRVK